MDEQKPSLPPGILDSMEQIEEWSMDTTLPDTDRTLEVRNTFVSLTGSIEGLMSRDRLVEILRQVQSRWKHCIEDKFIEEILNEIPSQHIDFEQFCHLLSTL
jgi:Ca2+-binding EF-hand superfamily protein